MENKEKPKMLSEIIEDLFDIEYFGHKGRANSQWIRLNELEEIDKQFLSVDFVRETIKGLHIMIVMNY
jgi:hypothetical protein